MTLECPYCFKPLPEPWTQCCGEVGHGVPAKALALALLLASPALADSYIGLSVGQSAFPVFENARFAFPDLAQGGPGCCNQTTEEDIGPAFRFVLGRSIGKVGGELAISNLGRASVRFDVSGPFGGSVQGPGYGSCVESGDFRITSLSAAGTYSHPIWGFVVVPKLGLSANWLKVKTESHCDLKTSVDVSQDYTRFSMSPLVGLGLKYPMGKYGLTADFEARRVTFSDNAEANRYGAGKPVVRTAWIGLERRF